MDRQVLDIEFLLEVVEEGYSRKAWHGPNLRGTLRGLSAEQAAWRPSRQRHNVWEIALHAAYWKYAVRRRILDQKRGSFPLKGSNWFSRPGGSERDWRADLQLLDDVHRSLIDAIRGIAPETLQQRRGGSKFTLAALICGVAHHDIYHAGQIQLIKRLMPF